MYENRFLTDIFILCQTTRCRFSRADVFIFFFNSTDCILEDVFRYGAGKAFSVKGLSDRAVFYSGLNLNQYGVASPCRT
ncbi:TPA: hypothetical protein ACLBHO_002041, partial [Neisseria meningitidis]